MRRNEMHEDKAATAPKGPSKNAAAGGGFLVYPTALGACFTPEKLTEEHVAIRRSAEGFWAADVEPNLDGIRHKEPVLLLRVLRKSAEFGFTGISIPERFGGMELDL